MWGREHSSVKEHLPPVKEALGSIPSSSREKKKYYATTYVAAFYLVTYTILAKLAIKSVFTLIIHSKCQNL